MCREVNPGIVVKPGKLNAGDRIVGVDGTDITKMSLSEAVSQLKNSFTNAFHRFVLDVRSHNGFHPLNAKDNEDGISNGSNDSGGFKPGAKPSEPRKIESNHPKCTDFTQSFSSTDCSEPLVIEDSSSSSRSRSWSFGLEKPNISLKGALPDGIGHSNEKMPPAPELSQPSSSLLTDKSFSEYDSLSSSGYVVKCSVSVQTTATSMEGSSSLVCEEFVSDSFPSGTTIYTSEPLSTDSTDEIEEDCLLGSTVNSKSMDGTDLPELISSTLQDPMHTIWQVKTRTFSVGKLPNGKLGFKYKIKSYRLRSGGSSIYDLYTLVEDVSPASPAYGILLPGDNILSVDGQPISSTGEQDADLKMLVSRISQTMHETQENEVKIVIQRPEGLTARNKPKSGQQTDISSSSDQKQASDTSVLEVSSIRPNISADDSQQGLPPKPHGEAPEIPLRRKELEKLARLSKSAPTESWENCAKDERNKTSRDNVSKCISSTDKSDVSTVNRIDNDNGDNAAPVKRPSRRRKNSFKKGHRRGPSWPIVVEPALTGSANSGSSGSRHKNQRSKSPSSYSTRSRYKYNSESKILRKRAVKQVEEAYRSAAKEKLARVPFLKCFVLGQNTTETVKTILNIQDLKPNSSDNISDTYEMSVSQTDSDFSFKTNPKCIRKIQPSLIAGFIAQKMLQLCPKQETKDIAKELCQSNKDVHAIPHVLIGKQMLDFTGSSSEVQLQFLAVHNDKFSNFASRTFYTCHCMFVISLDYQEYIKDSETVLEETCNQITEIISYAGNQVPIFLVLHASDKTTKEDIEKLGSYFDNYFMNVLMYSKTSNLPLFVLPSACAKPNACCDDSQELQQMIGKVSIKQTFIQKQYCLSSLMVQQELERTVTGYDRFKSVAGLKALIQSVCGIDDLGDLELVLEYLHQSGSLVWKGCIDKISSKISSLVNHFALVQPHSLITYLEKLAYLPLKSEQDPPTRSNWNQLATTGYVNEGFVEEHILKKFYDAKEMLAFLQAMKFVYTTDDDQSCGVMLQDMPQRICFIPYHMPKSLPPLEDDNDNYYMVINFHGLLSDHAFMLLLLGCRELCIEFGGEGTLCLTSSVFDCPDFWFQLTADKASSQVSVLLRCNSSNLAQFSKLIKDLVNMRFSLWFPLPTVEHRTSNQLRKDSDCSNPDLNQSNQLALSCKETVESSDKLSLKDFSGQTGGLRKAEKNQSVILSTKLRDVPLTLWKSITMALDVPKPFGSDWTGVAGHLGKTCNQVSLYARQPSPCSCLLQEWSQSSNATIRDLLDILEQPDMDRVDIVEDVIQKWLSDKMDTHL